MMRFMKEGIFMNQEIIKVTLFEQGDADILRFQIDKDELDINLNSSECQNSLKKLFTLILEKAVDRIVEIELKIHDEYSRRMYIEVCEEYVRDLNRELRDVAEIIKKEIAK